MKIKYSRSKVFCMAHIVFGSMVYLIIGGCGGLPISAVSGATLFRVPQLTNFGSQIACTVCHGEDGSGSSASDIHGSTAEMIENVVQGTQAHAADPRGRSNIKFPNLSTNDFISLSLFLSDINENTPTQ